MNMNFLRSRNGTIAIAAGCVLIGAWIWRARHVRSRIAKEMAAKRLAHEPPRLGPNDVKVIVKVSMEDLMGEVEARVPYTITELVNGKRETVTSAATIKFPAGMWTGLCVVKPQLGNLGDDGKYGSLVVELSEEAHSKGFYRHEDKPEDVHLDFFIEPKDLLNPRHSIIVPTLLGDEMVQVDIPRGSQYGDFLKLENFGFPVLYGGDAKGDQLVHLVSEQDTTEDE